VGLRVSPNTPQFATEAQERCRQEAREKLPHLLIELCINPRLEVKAGQAHQPSHREFASDGAAKFETPTLAVFDDVIAALFELQRASRAALPDTFAETQISRKVFSTLDYALKTRRMVLIEGREGIGKTEAARAWCAQHEGEAHFVSASGICNSKSLFTEISRALGIGVGQRKTTDLQGRLESVLKRTGTLLVIDEAHFLFGYSERMYSRPYLLDWLHTLYNHGLRLALLCTPQLLRFMTRAEQQVGWNSGQFKRRVKRWALLPDHPSEGDFKSVARKLLPDADDRAREAAVLYAVTSKRNMSALVDVCDEAKLIAAEAGRSRITLADMRSAISDYRLPSDNAMYRTVEPPRPKRPGRPDRLTAMPLPPPGSDTATALPAREITPRTPRPGGDRNRVSEQEEPAHA
jgi:DNA transposition AAA+ family ATPase